MLTVCSGKKKTYRRLSVANMRLTWLSDIMKLRANSSSDMPRLRRTRNIKNSSASSCSLGRPQVLLWFFCCLCSVRTPVAHATSTRREVFEKAVKHCRVHKSRVKHALLGDSGNMLVVRSLATAASSLILSIMLLFCRRCTVFCGSAIFCCASFILPWVQFFSVGCLVSTSKVKENKL